MRKKREMCLSQGDGNVEFLKNMPRKKTNINTIYEMEREGGKRLVVLMK